MNDISPLTRLERDVVDDSVSLASLLRQVMVIGGRASSAELRHWAKQELEGYADTDVAIPSYRRLPATIQMDWSSGPRRWTGVPISTVELPEQLRGRITEEVPLPFSVAEIQATVDNREPGRPVKLTYTGMVGAARIMTSQQQERGNLFAEVHSVYWAVAPASLQGVLDRIRTRLTEFVAELRAAMPEGEDEPTAEQVSQVFQYFFVATGNDSPVNIAAPLAQAVGAEARAEANMTPAPAPAPARPAAQTESRPGLLKRHR
ncbi:AbiTii domain-containing protein [Kitasatospora sp. NBC_01302]|uniref:AbiTii domain-containing protein n=1 Tax=Kitasatospora sp. NBC_01302 TaxID=2903575 RepID=UPI002E106235|nr:hypothetical protein OG294_20070 [Kitasatospora sp. NBC_01302]